MSSKKSKFEEVEGMLYIQQLSAVKYSISETIIDDAEVGAYKAYGIQVSDDEGNDLLKKEDISLDLERIQRLVDDLNTHGASIHHIDDIIEDFWAFDC